MTVIKIKKLKFTNTKENKRAYRAYRKINEFTVEYVIDVRPIASHLQINYSSSNDNGMLKSCLLDSYDEAVDAANNHLRSYVKDNLIIELV